GLERGPAVAGVAILRHAVDRRDAGHTMHDAVGVDHANQVIAGVGKVQVAVIVEHDAPGRRGRLTKGLSHAHLGGRDLVAGVAGRARQPAELGWIAARPLARGAVGAVGALDRLDTVGALARTSR